MTYGRQEFVEECEATPHERKYRKDFLWSIISQSVESVESVEGHTHTHTGQEAEWMER